MKKQKMNKKISLNKETIAKLGAEEMGKLNGGDLNIIQTYINGGCVPVTILYTKACPSIVCTIDDLTDIIINPVKQF